MNPKLWICTLLVVATAFFWGCANDSGEKDIDDENVPPSSDPAAELTLPPINADFDYQLGGAYTPPAGTHVVTRDRNANPEPGLYNICYINGFQTQPGEESDWEPDLILRDTNGDPIIDSEWNEMLLDIGTADKRARIATLVSRWIKECSAAGFDAVEIDNLDSYTRSNNFLIEDDAVTLMALLSSAAHEIGLPIAQKNSAELLYRKVEMGTDFAVAEECSAWEECQDYIDAYGSYVLMIEYNEDDFKKGCSDYGDSHSIILRDYDLVTPSNPDYVHDNC